MKGEDQTLPSPQPYRGASITVVYFFLDTELLPLIMVAFLIVLTTFSTPSWGQVVCGNRTPIGRVVDLEIVGDQPVEVRRAGESVWARADKGMTLCSTDQIRTRFRSRAHIRLGAEAVGGPIDLVIGVNARIRTTGEWGSHSRESSDPPILEIVHGVVRIRADIGADGASYHVRSGPTACAFRGGEALSNWDPFKREANHVVLSGNLSCAFDDSVVVVGPGHRLEIIAGDPMPLKATSSLMLDAFSRATDFD